MDEGSNLVGDITYPFFFYQIPELIPNLVIALGVSPPNGVLRQWYRLTVYAGMVARYHLRRCCLGVGDGSLPFPQQSVFDEGGGGGGSTSAVRGDKNSEADAPCAGAAADAMRPQFVGNMNITGDQDEEAGHGVVSPVHAAAGAGTTAPRSHQQQMRISLATSDGGGDGTAGYEGPAGLGGKSSFQVSRGSALSMDKGESGSGPRHTRGGSPAVGGGGGSSFLTGLSGGGRSTGSLSARSTGSKKSTGKWRAGQLAAAVFVAAVC